jgi:taurine transport system permease protein
VRLEERKRGGRRHGAPGRTIFPQREPIESLDGIWAVVVDLDLEAFREPCLDPLIEFYRPLPPLAYLPLVIIWLGIGELAKVVLIFLAVFAPICLNTRAGVRAVPREQLLAAASLGASRMQLIRHVVLPAALPEILTGMRVGIGFGWTTLVAAEMVAAESGLGFLVLNAKDFLATDVVIAGIFVIGVIAYGFDLALRWVEAKVVPWKGLA